MWTFIVRIPGIQGACEMTVIGFVDDRQGAAKKCHQYAACAATRDGKIQILDGWFEREAEIG